MKKSIILFFYILLLSSYLYSQNKTTKNGLKTGFWKTEYSREYYDVNQEGRYKILLVNKLDTIPKSYFHDHVDVKYKNDTAWIDYEERKGDSIVVQHGLWKYYDSLRLNLEYLYKYKRGINLWRKSFNSDGSLFDHTHSNFKKGITYFDHYEGGKLFERRYYLPGKPNDDTVVYYPNARLCISDAEPRFDYNFLKKEQATQNIQIACKKPLKILSITPHSTNFQIQPSHSLPLNLKPQDTFNLTLNYIPSPITVIEQDTITIKTLENGSVHEYRILALTSAVHIDYKNVEHTSAIALSQSKDRYLLIDRLGTQTDACVRAEPEDACFQVIAGLAPHICIDLKAFQPGVYGVYISSCSKYGTFRLVITE